MSRESEHNSKISCLVSLLVWPSGFFPLGKEKSFQFDGKIYNRVWPPLALANCAALLEKQGHQVQIIDANALRLFPDKVAQSVISFDKKSD